jgi:hypothetical protein
MGGDYDQVCIGFCGKRDRLTYGWPAKNQGFDSV